MPFSRYEIRNEFSLADPELYKSADKDDPEALLEGVAMAGLVGVLRQLGDLAEFAAEIFHGLHEEVMVTAARGHDLLVRVQQVESDFPSIERAFLSQTGHSPFFSSSGISWHPNLQVEQNLITKGDLPRFVMDSYEESRGPPRLFLLDKFDVAGAGACLKRYTDPSFFKVETSSSYEMMSAETQRDKKIRKTKKKGAQWKNGDTPDVFQPAHVKLHQLLLEERVQNVASEPARRVKLKKRELKFPFDTETGKGYMERLLSSPPEDKLVHEVPVGYSPPRLPTNSPGESGLEPLEGRMVNSPLASPYESPIVDKTVSREHMDNVPDSVPELQPEFQANGAHSGFEEEEEEVEEKHISINKENNADGIENSYQYEDVASETDNFMDAVATMESEVETVAELRANSDPTTKQLESHSSDSQSASDDESSPLTKNITNFSYSDSTSISVESTSPHGVISSQAFASTEIPFRPRVSPNQSFDESAADEALPLDEGVIFNGSTSKESTLSEMLSNNCVDVNSPKRITEIEIDPKEIIASSSYVEIPQWEADNEDNNDNSTLVMSHVEKHPFGHSEESDICDEDSESSTSGDVQAVKEISDDIVESKFDPVEFKVSYSSEDELEYKDRGTVSVFLESEDANANVYHPADDRNGLENLQTPEDRKEMEEESKSVYLVTNGVDDNRSKVLSTCEDIQLEDECTEISTAEEHAENGSVIKQSGVVQNASESVETESSEQSVISPELDSISSASCDHSNVQFPDSIQNNGIEKNVDNSYAEEKPDEFGEQKRSNGQSVISPEIDSVPAAFNDHSNIQDVDSAFTSSFPSTRCVVNENGDDNPSANLEILHNESLFSTENIDQGVPKDQSNAQTLDSRVLSFDVLADDEGVKTSKLVDQHVESEFPDQDGQTDELEHTADEPHMPSVQLGTVDTQNHVDHETHVNHVSQSEPIDPESYQLEQAKVFQDSSMAQVSQLNSQFNLSGLDMLPQLAPINMEEMPPLPPLPPMQWRMGKLPNSSLVAGPDGSQNDNATNNEFEHGHNDSIAEENDSLAVSSEHNAVKFEDGVIQAPPFDREQYANTSTSGREIIKPSSTSSLPLINEEGPNGIRPMKIQRVRTPLISAVAAHDKSLLKKVSERAVPLFPKEEERDTLLEQIRAKSVNLKPAVQTRPSIQGPSTNLRVAAILEKANAIRHAFAGSDDDEDDDDSWSDS
ncbi:protein SCAR2-like [Rutidosis leptorrhynchoides]|uniref:protein SCAR2-like n=1 Tax=Rutidosis leptorrhynchoides TaxID=125765 RepID=UPI003A9A581D